MKKNILLAIVLMTGLLVSACAKKIETKTETIPESNTIEVSQSEELETESNSVEETETIEECTEEESAEGMLEDGTRRVIIDQNSVSDNGDGTSTVECKLFELVVLPEDEVKSLKVGDAIKISQYPGLSDIEIYSIINKSQDVYEVNETYMLEPNSALNGYTIRGLDDDMVRFETQKVAVICDENTVIEDEMGAIVYGNSENTCKSIAEASEKYGRFDATITSEGGKAKHIIVHYHP